MKKTKIINYLVSVTDIRCPKGEPIVFSALETDVPRVLNEFSDCVVVVRELNQFSDLITSKDETDC